MYLPRMPEPCNGRRPDGAPRTHCTTCYRDIDALGITPMWRIVPATKAHLGTAVCLSHRDEYALRHLATVRDSSPPVCGGLVSRVTGCFRALFKRGGAA